jgi:opacity protein-like surface antigen
MKKILAGVILMILLTCLSTAPNAEAAWNYTFEPAVSLGLQYDSNIFFDEEDQEEEDDLGYNARLQVPFTAESPTTSLSFNYSTSYFQYDSESDADYDNHVLNFSLSHALTRRIQLSLSERYSLTEDPDRIYGTGSAEGETGIIVDRDKRRNNSVTGSVTYALSQRASMSLSARNGIYRYDNPGNYDSTSNGGSLSFSYSISPKDTVFTGVSFTESDYERNERQRAEDPIYVLIGIDPIAGTQTFGLALDDEFDQSQFSSAYIGWTRQISQTLNISLSLGGRESKNTNNEIVFVSTPGMNASVPHSLPVGTSTVEYIVQGNPTPVAQPVTTAGRITLPDVSIVKIDDDEDRNSGLLYNLTVNKEFRKSSLTFGASLDYWARRAEAGTSERRSANVDYNHNFTERLSGSLSGRYDDNKEESDFLDDDYETYRASAGLSYAITRNFSPRLTYHYTLQKRDRDNNLGTERTERDLITLDFNYLFPILR